jgi:2-polyprenyl-3-methyl-5-hydroxy-6-metoxy-1,4-benzoquinol methylase
MKKESGLKIIFGTKINMKENDIRPKEVMEGQKTAMAIDIGRMLTMSEKFVPVNCPACGKNDSYVKFEKYHLFYRECKNCETIYINPRGSAEVLNWFYKGSVNYDYWNKYIFPASEEARRSKIFIPRVNRVLELCDKYKINTDSILEIGCAFGTFCVEMQSRNRFKRIVGVEPTHELAETSRKRGIEVIEDFVENIHFKEEERFDVIVNFEVIEHLFSPKELIMQSKELLNKGGLLMITCPNGKGFDFTVLGEKCNNLDHEHLNYFNPKSLTILLESCGFEVLECLTPGKLDAELVRNKILSGAFDVTTQPFLKQILIDEWETKGEMFQKFISDSGLSSSLWVIARK